MTRADSWSEARRRPVRRPARAWTPTRPPPGAPEATTGTTPRRFDAALTELLAGRARSCGTARPTVTTSLDVARQALSNRSRVLLPQIKAAYEAGDRARFDQADRDLARAGWTCWTSCWPPTARICSGGGSPTPVPGAPTAAEKDRLEYDARSLHHHLGRTRASSDEGLHDYANREWAGLVGGLYRLRWKTYFDALRAALAAGREPAKIDWFALEDRWAHRHDSTRCGRRATSTSPGPAACGTPWPRTPHQVALTACADRGAVAEGTPGDGRRVTFTNSNGFGPARGVSLSVDAPEGMAAEPVGTATAASVAPGETFAAALRVALTAAAGALVCRVPRRRVLPDRRLAGLGLGGGPADGGTGVGDRTARPPSTTPCSASPGTRSPSRAGAPICGVAPTSSPRSTGPPPTGRPRPPGPGHLAGPTGGWARAGLIVRNDLSADGGGSAGYVNLAVTPSNGCALCWDADGDGHSTPSNWPAPSPPRCICG